MKYIYILCAILVFSACNDVQKQSTNSIQECQTEEVSNTHTSTKLLFYYNGMNPKNSSTDFIGKSCWSPIALFTYTLF